MKNRPLLCIALGFLLLGGGLSLASGSLLLGGGRDGAALMLAAWGARTSIMWGWFLCAGVAAFGFASLVSLRTLSERYAAMAFSFLLLQTIGKWKGLSLPSGVAWAQSGWLFLWVTPLALAALYRVLPERAGTRLPEEGAARFGFWMVALFGGWAGAARIASGPVAAWIGTAGIVAAMMLSLAGVAWMVVLVSLLRTGGWDRIRESTGGGFLLVASFAFPVWLALVWVAAFRCMGSHLHLTLFDAATDDLCLLGLGTMALLGFFCRASLGHRIAFWLCLGGVSLLVGGEMLGGTLQALAFTDSTVPFAAVGSLLKPFLWMRLIGWGLFELGIVAYFFGLWEREMK